MDKDDPPPGALNELLDPSERTVLEAGQVENETGTEQDSDPDESGAEVAEIESD